MKLIADEIGASLKWATVTIHKPERGAVRARPETPTDDPWASAPAEEEPPF